MKQGWEVRKLGDVCELINRGVSPKYTETNGLIVLNQKCIRNHEVNYDLARVHDNKVKPVNSEKLIKIGDVLINSTGTGTLGRVAQIRDEPNEATVDSHITIVRPLPNFFYNEFFGYALILIEEKIAERGEGCGGQTELARNTLKNEFYISFPKSIQEQQAIVSILDEAFAAIAQAKANAEQNLQNAKELFESYLHSVFENKGDDWINSTIGETCNLQTGGTPSTSKKEFYDGGSIKWLVSGDINQKIINDCEGRITELGMNSSNTKFLPVNSVLIALNDQGKTRGTVAMLKTKATCNQSLVSIYPKDDNSLLPELIFSNLEGRYEEIRKITGDSGNDRRGLNMPLIRSIQFSYPKKLTDQENIITKLDNLRTRTKQLEVIYQQKINDLDELKKSILQKAFAGELNTSALELEV